MSKYKWNVNIGLKLIALLSAVVLWFVVVNTDDPVTQKRYSNIPVTITNSEVVTYKGKTFNVVDDINTVTVTVYAKRSVLDMINSSHITAVADLSQMEVNTWLVPITVSIQGFEGRYESAQTDPNNLQINIEVITKKTFPISVTATGTPMEGYVEGTMTVNPKEVEIGGSESAINNIQKVIAKVNIAGMEESATRPAELYYLDNNGNIIPFDSSYLSTSIEEDELVSVNVQILKKKDVKLKFNTSGSPLEGYVCSEVTSEPESVEVCGTEKDLKDFNTLTIPADEIDISGARSKKTFIVDILPYLPEGVELVDTTANNVIVTVKIEKKGAKTVDLPVESIRIKNLKDDLKVSFPIDSNLELQFSGSADNLEMLDSQYAASIDLEGYTEAGTYIVPVAVEVGSNATLISAPTVTVTLKTKE